MVSQNANLRSTWGHDVISYLIHLSDDSISTLLLLGIVHADFEDWRTLVAQKRNQFGVLVEFVDAAATILVPEQEVLIMADTEGMTQLLPFIYSLRGKMFKYLTCISTYNISFLTLASCHAFHVNARCCPGFLLLHVD